MKARLKRYAIYWTGWGFILLGIAGLFLPILQGILFLLIGLALLSNTSPWAARLLLRLRTRFPAVSKKFDEAMVKAREVQGRMFKKKNKEARDMK
ncbi:MAG TPA: PGPGW domain-containing protein [Blastocatellia bacterium]|jgi:uncharacterized membrane protein YbaN (DUF454 family)|nr:PGPGW domain-containing protein [Blastocatellia bacterium]